MEIIVIGSESNFNECRLKYGSAHNYKLCSDQTQAMKIMKQDSIIFDFEPNDVSVYNQDCIVFLNSVTTTLTQLASRKESEASLFGFCGIPSFLNREIFEVTILKKETQIQLEKVCAQLKTKYKVVDDRVGMITPRIICMIINEAFFAIEENVASRADIDLAMKLGTNYPFGPFEWCEKIGIKNVYELLNAVYNETKDERYKICELLKKEATLTSF